MPDFTTWSLEDFETLLKECEDAEMGIEEMYGDTAASCVVASELLKRLQART